MTIPDHTTGLSNRAVKGCGIDAPSVPINASPVKIIVTMIQTWQLFDYQLSTTNIQFYPLLKILILEGG
jgi:hypothetical protein